jgi:hypothetical protein
MTAPTQSELGPQFNPSASHLSASSASLSHVAAMSARTVLAEGGRFSIFDRQSAARNLLDRLDRLSQRI